MRNSNRKSAPKVRDGKVQRKNRSALTPNYWSHDPSELVVDRERPGQGYRQLLQIKDVYRFLDLLPDWKELGVGVRSILIDEGNPNTLGWYDNRGIVAVCAWRKELEREWPCWFVDDNGVVLDRLNVPCVKIKDGGAPSYLCKFTEQTARGFQLMEVLLHELGHHYDRMTTKSKARSARGEWFAEEYALKYAEQIWESYFKEFGY